MVYEYVTQEILEKELQTYVDVLETKDKNWELFFDWQDTDIVAFSINNESNLISQIVVNPKAKDVENLYNYSTNFEYDKIIITDFEHFEKEYSCCQSTDTYCDGYYGDYGFSSGSGKSVFWKPKKEGVKNMYIRINGQKRSLNRIILITLLLVSLINLYIMGDNKKVYAVYDIGTQTYCDYTSGDWSFRQVPIEDVPQEILSRGLPPKTEYQTK